jgi:hypothetical protein
MYELPIIARLARDLVAAQFDAADDPRAPTAARSARRARTAPAAPVRTTSARLLRALADLVEPTRDPRPRSA